MIIIEQILITLALYILLEFLSTNLIGFFIRSLFSQSKFNQMETEANIHEAMKVEIKKN
jgi:hypothetical protein